MSFLPGFERPWPAEAGAPAWALLSGCIIGVAAWLPASWIGPSNTGIWMWLLTTWLLSVGFREAEAALEERRIDRALAAILVVAGFFGGFQFALRQDRATVSRRATEAASRCEPIAKQLAQYAQDHIHWPNTLEAAGAVAQPMRGADSIAYNGGESPRLLVTVSGLTLERYLSKDPNKPVLWIGFSTHLGPLRIEGPNLAPRWSLY